MMGDADVKTKPSISTTPPYSAKTVTLQLSSALDVMAPTNAMSVTPLSIEDSKKEPVSVTVDFS